MSSSETKQTIKEMKAFTKKIKDDPTGKLAHDFLVGAGIITQSGRVRKPYRNLFKKENKDETRN